MSTDSMPAKTAPVQTHHYRHYTARKPSRIPFVVHERAYEVYCHVHSPQRALMEGECRGGFGMCELVAFLYAYGFPREQWRTRVDEAYHGMQGV